MMHSPHCPKAASPLSGGVDVRHAACLEPRWRRSRASERGLRCSFLFGWSAPRFSPIGPQNLKTPHTLRSHFGSSHFGSSNLAQALRAGGRAYRRGLSCSSVAERHGHDVVTPDRLGERAGAADTVAPRTPLGERAGAADAVRLSCGGAGASRAGALGAGAYAVRLVRPTARKIADYDAGPRGRLEVLLLVPSDRRQGFPHGAVQHSLARRAVRYFSD